MSAAQILALVIFVSMFVLIISDKIERHYITLGCAALTLIGVFGICMHSPEAIMESLNIKQIFTLEFWYTTGAESESAGINWATIIFIAGMMFMVEGMTETGFFRWLCMKLAKMVQYRPIPLLIAFMVMSFVLSMFIDSITVILFLAAVTVELSKLLKLDPIPMILAEIFCANLGGSATMCGDPPNIIIGTSLRYTFTDFLFNTGVFAFINLVLVIIYYYLVNRKELEGERISAEDIEKLPKPEEAIKNRKDFTMASLVFACAVVMLVTHEFTGFTVALIGVIVSVITALVVKDKTFNILKRVDTKTLLFFIGLFVVVSGLELTGVLGVLARGIGVISGGNLRLMVGIILWLSAIASAVVDNIPFAATMIPIIKTLAATQGVELSTLAYTLAIGTDIGGSATPIGASANVVGTSVAAKNGYPIGWGKYLKESLPATLIVIFTSMIMLFVRYT